MIKKKTFFENTVVYEIMWKNIAGSDKLQMTIWCMRTACWIRMTKHSEYVVRIAFPLQQYCTCAPQCYATLPPLQMEQASFPATPVTITICTASNPTRLEFAFHSLEQLIYRL